VKRHLALSAIGRDRPGIVAGLTRALYEQGCNLEDSSMTLLAGDFAVLLLTALPEGKESGPVRVALEAEAKKLGLTLQVRELSSEEAAAARSTGRPHTLVVYGADKPGIVHRVTEAAARHGFNITDLRSQLTGTETRPVYSLILELDVSRSQEADLFRNDLSKLKDELGVELTFETADTDEM
jgi:glycine cleavage system transcriptional repressor